MSDGGVKLDTSSATMLSAAAAAAGVAPPAFSTREDAKRKREMDEARKSGLIPAEKDEEGKDINPHIPQYIAKAPWYLTQDCRPSLKHQRFSAEHQANVHKWYSRGLVRDSPALHYRAGACENCGAISHTAKDCTDRPRKKGAKWTGKDIRPDELIVEDSAVLDLDFDGKRDRYGGYDPASYRLVLRDFELADQERKRRKAEQLKADLMDSGTGQKKDDVRGVGSKDSQAQEAGCDGGTDGEQQRNSTNASSQAKGELLSDEAVAAAADEGIRVGDFDRANAPIGVKDDHTRTTSMNLRIREDTAKYLFNLDVNSAFYDPKSRSMRDNPLRHLPDTEQGVYQGDNVIRTSGEAQQLLKMEVFAWDAYTHNLPVHTQAQPTQLELLYKNHAGIEARLTEAKRQNLLEKYRAAEQRPLPPDLMDAQSESYVEVLGASEDGKKIRTRKKVPMAQSKYQEDVYFGQHTAIWGSWWEPKERRWGFACCKQLNRFESECGGEEST